MASSSSRKLQTLSLSQKYEIVTFCERNTNVKKDAAAKFNIPPTTLSGFLAVTSTIKADYEAGSVSTSAKRKRTFKFTEIDEALLIWFALV